MLTTVRREANPWMRAHRSFSSTVQSGGQVETGDRMPDEYRSRLVKFIEMHGNLS